MPKRKHSGLSRFFGNGARRFADDTDGVSLVEFAFMFPVLLMILLMIITGSHTMMIDRKVTMTAQAAADLVSQRQDVDNIAIQEINRATELMMRPFAANFDISIAHVPFSDPGGNPDMDAGEAWRALINGADPIASPEAESVAAGGSISAPDPGLVGPLGTPGDALIMLRMNYEYQSIWASEFSFFGVTFPGNLTFTKVSFARPRLNRQITSTDPVISVP